MGELHLLRPLWLWVLLPAFLIWFGHWRFQDRVTAWKKLIDPHLLEHLLVERQRRRRLRPIHLTLILWVLCVVALAGPSWEREPSPFADDQAGLMVLLRAGTTMNATDVQPSRLERATQKIQDLLALRPGAKTGLVDYSGSAHLVMPLTTDPKIIEMFSQALSPEIMPRQGDVAVQALELAGVHLEKAKTPGSVLLIADQVAPEQIKGLQTIRQKSKIPVHILAVAADKGVTVPPGSPPAPHLDRDAMEKAADAAGADLTIVTPDDRDVRKLAGRIKTSFSAEEQSQGGDRWQDAGYWLLPILMVLGLFFFRRGWIVAYE